MLSRARPIIHNARRLTTYFAAVIRPGSNPNDPVFTWPVHLRTEISLLLHQLSFFAGFQQRDHPDQAGNDPDDTSSDGQQISGSNANRDEYNPCYDESDQTKYLIATVVHGGHPKLNASAPCDGIIGR